MAGVWILVERRDQALELLGIGRQLADKMGVSLSVMIADAPEGAKVFIAHGADEVILLPALPEGQAPDTLIPLIAEETGRANPDLLLLPATYRGKELAARIAARLKTGLCSSCTALTFDEGSKSLVMDRLAFGGAAVQKVSCSTRPVMATIPPRTFEPAPEVSGREGKVRELAAPPPSAVKILERKARTRETKDITESRVVVCVGRGVEKKEDISLARELAEALGGEVAGTRPVTEELHWLPEELCIGLSGISVKPDLYIGLGVSGQIQHVTGISRSKVIAAVNKDENAPIFGAADLGIVGNLYDVIPKLIEALKKTP
jgi:electron transfer flavoprotein alpha subunit